MSPAERDVYPCAEHGLAIARLEVQVRQLDGVLASIDRKLTGAWKIVLLSVAIGAAIGGGPNIIAAVARLGGG